MNVTEMVGWTLVQFVWQGTAIAAVLALALAVTRHRAASTRYALGVGALAVMLIAPVVTASWMAGRPAGVADVSPSIEVPTLSATAHPRDGVAPVTKGGDAPVTEMGSSLGTRGVSRGSQDRAAAAPSFRSESIRSALPYIVAAWITGVLLLALRLIGGWAQVQRLRRVGVRPVPGAVRAVFAHLAARMGLRRTIELLETAVLDAPAAIGWLRPVILIPASAFTGLSPMQLEALLAHELAHIRRYDYAVNLVQSLVETLLFYHPAVWWVSSRVREEREHCCDDLAAATCGDARLLAGALASMEQLRVAPPALAMAATRGSLLTRVRRLIEPRMTHAEGFSRWVAGALAVGAVLMVGGGVRWGGATEPAEAQETGKDERLLKGELRSTNFAPRAGEQVRDTIIHHPDSTRALPERWSWARTEAARNRYTVYWVGYRIPAPPNSEGWMYVDRDVTIRGHGMTISGNLFGDFDGFRFPGTRLGARIGGGEPDDILMLFGFSTVDRGQPVLARVHLSSLVLPVDLEGRALFWLGAGNDRESVPLIEGLFGAVQSRRLLEDLVAAVGVHSDAALVVPLLRRLLETGESGEIRKEAAEWLGRQASAEGLGALARSARRDPSQDVRREAAESIGEVGLPAATDTLIALVRSSQDAEVRREAVEAFAERDDDKALQATMEVAQSDRNVDVQREAVETLGEFSNGRGLPMLRQLVRDHANPEVRREAVETLVEASQGDDVIELLVEIARSDPNADVQREAVETLAELDSQRARAVIVELAGNHADADVRREAVEALASTGSTEEAMAALARIAREDRNADVAREAVETLGEIDDPRATALILEIAKTHPNVDVRREAVETLGETSRGEPPIDALADIARNDRDPDIQREAVETLGELRDARALKLVEEIARTHPDPDVRREAIETVIENGEGQTKVEFLKELAENDRNADVQREAVEQLGELHDSQAWDLLERIALTHADVDVRREAIETIAESAPASRAIALLKRVAVEDRSEDAREEALESLAELADGAGIPAIIELARSTNDRRLMVKALEVLGESDDPRAEAALKAMVRGVR